MIQPSMLPQSARILPIRPEQAIAAEGKRLEPASGVIVKFSGREVRQAGKNGLWLTVEREPAMKGGLGQVSRTIPAALNKHLGKDIRVLMPYLSPLKAQGGFENTGLSVTLKDQDGVNKTFWLMQKYEAENQTWVYTVANEEYFGRFNNLYFGKEEAITFENFDKQAFKQLPDWEQEDLVNRASWRAIQMFNRAAAHFAPMLNGGAPQAGKLKQFDGKAEFVVANDWHTGHFTRLLPEEYRQDLGRVFMFHNNFDTPRKVAEAKAMGIPYRSVYYQSPENPDGFSLPLAEGIEDAHVVVADRNYMVTNTKTDFAKGQGFVRPLSEKLDSGRVVPFHHVPDDVNFNAETSPHLKSDGYTLLNTNLLPTWKQRFVESLKHLLNLILPASWKLKPIDWGARLKNEELLRFKRENKLALQRSLGLREDKNAVIMSWVARFDPNQKGFYMLMNEAKSLLLRHPNLQLVMAGAEKENPVILRFVQEMNADARFRGRLYLPNEFVKPKEAARIYAGSDYVILPSSYEPYGLTQLEAYKLGCIPIVHGVDGLRTTVCDPTIERLEDGPDEPVQKYQQTGLKMMPYNVPVYREGVTSITKGQPLTPEQAAVLKAGQQQFSVVMERAMTLAENPAHLLQVRQNGMRYVNTEHRWEILGPQFDKAIQQAIAAAQQEAKQGMQLQTTA